MSELAVEDFFLRRGESHEARFKRVCTTLLDRDIFPSPSVLARYLPNKLPTSRNLNGRECQWRTEVLTAHGYIKGVNGRWQLRPGLTHAYDVVVQGKRYKSRGSSVVSVRLLRAGALKRHGIINWKMTADLDRTWEVRDASGRELSSKDQVEAATVGTLYINPRPGWGG